MNALNTPARLAIRTRMSIPGFQDQQGMAIPDLIKRQREKKLRYEVFPSNAPAVTL